jgi:NAD(P)-dependent dehydrogenase (short-subunit alcohol dehydrogenase family)
VCRTLARQGARVVVADIDETSARAVADEIVGAGGDAIHIAVDLADEASVAAMAASVAERYGGVDVLDNNAALTAADVLARDGAVTDMDLGVWDQMMAVNLRSQLLTCKHLVPQMVARGGGAVVNMSSGAANAGHGRARSHPHGPGSGADPASNARGLLPVAPYAPARRAA